MKNHTIIVILCAFLITYSCTQYAEDFDSPNLTFESRAIEANTDDYRTYKLMTYDVSNLRPYTNIGTYEKPIGTSTLKPCVLDEYGVKVNASDTEHKNAQLKGVGYTYVIAVSPGVRHNDDGSFDFNPFEPTDPFLSSESLRLNLGHIMTYNLGALKDRRCIININIEAGQEGTSTKTIQIEDFYLVGAGTKEEKVRYYPATRQTIATDGRLEVDLTHDDSYTKYSFSDLVYIMAGIYASKSEAAQILNKVNDMTYIQNRDYLYVSFQLKQNGRDWVHIQKPLTNVVKELLPQHQYDYTFKVTSEYVSLKLDITNLYDAQDPFHWADNHILDNQEIGGKMPTVSIDLGHYNFTSKNGWTDNDLPNQEIN